MISVIIPVFNGAAYIAEAIESVLCQTLPAAEVIVVDDGSLDETAEVARRYQPRVAYRWQANQGPGAARNRGISEARGEALAFLDSDDVWLPEKLRLQKAALDEDPELDLVFSHVRQFRAPEISLDETAAPSFDDSAQPGPLISCLLARRDAFERRPLRTDLKAEFVDWYLHAQEAGLKMRILDAVLVKRRIHASNFTLQHKDVRQEYLKLLKAALDRRRAKVTGAATADRVL
jgi:glycosyltransferase involved in cell wall biosynthesis